MTTISSYTIDRSKKFAVIDKGKIIPLRRNSEIESGWYNKNLKIIEPNEKEIGAILFVTKDLDSLRKFLKKLDFKKLKKKVQYAKNDVIVDVFNGWNDLTIKVYAKIDYKIRHKDYLEVK